MVRSQLVAMGLGISLPIVTIAFDFIGRASRTVSGIATRKLSPSNGVSPREQSNSNGLQEGFDMVTRLPRNVVIPVGAVEPARRRTPLVLTPPIAVGRVPIDVTPFPRPFPLAPSHTTNLFDGVRRGKPVVRADDLVALRIELVNMTVMAGPPPIARANPSGKAFIVLHFPPQSIGEQAFFQAAQPAKSNSSSAENEQVDAIPHTVPAETSTDDGVDPPPVLARIADESRLAFEIPSGFEATYTLAGLLATCEQLTPSVPANALPRQSAPRRPRDLVITVADAKRLTVRELAGVARLKVRMLSAPASFSLASTGGLLQRQITGVAFNTLKDRFNDVAVTPGVFRVKPKPADPTPTQTAIEMPWRLVLAPHAAERFRHAAQPVTSPVSQRTEMWHSRMVLPVNGEVPPAPPPDANRTVRAVWARTDDTGTAMKPDFPGSGDLPLPSDFPFMATMDDRDRYQIAHLSSNFSVPAYVPQPVQADRLMLSSLGGWLNARGAWEPPGLDVEEWVNHATMGRDHYVRVVYRGVLCCLGHRVSLVKVTERKFHNGQNGTAPLAGNGAYLRQRLFLVVRERERSYVEPGLTDPDGRLLHNQFLFTRVRILTTVTPDLDLPSSAPSTIKGFNDRRMFWPCVTGQPFRFDCVGEDLEGRQVSFSIPLIFVTNSLASPRTDIPSGFKPDVPAARDAAQQAAIEWLTRNDTVGTRTVPRRRAPMSGQQLAFAPAHQTGDTSAPVESIDFGIRANITNTTEVPLDNVDLHNYSQNLTLPMFFPIVDTARVKLPALSQLAGGSGTSVLSWNTHYLKNGYTGNPGEVFMEVDAVAQPHPPANASVAALDFSRQSDRSGGFVMPNLRPTAWSRLAGPVSGVADDFRQGTFKPANAFPSSGLGGLPLPLIFGCIPLGDVIESVGDFANGAGLLPKFVAEASNKIDSFVSELLRLFEVVKSLADNPGSIAEAAIGVTRQTLQDLAAQALAYAAAQAAPVKAAIAQLDTALNQLASVMATLRGASIDAAPSLPGLTVAAGSLQTALAQLGAAVGDASGLPAGFRQSVRALVTQAESLRTNVLALPPLISAAKTLFTALKDVVGNPNTLAALFANPALLEPKLTAIQAALSGLRTALASGDLLDGAPRKAVLQALDAVAAALGLASDLLKLLEQLTGEELVVRFDWQPEMKSWGLAPNEPILRVNDKHGFIIAVEARIKRSGGASKVSVLCGLKHFDLVLVAPASFIELNFEKIEFTVDTSAKMNVDVLLTDIKFVGPLSFVETLRDLIPLDGFSDPPALDISEKGIDASFSVALPAIGVGMFNLSNLSLGAGFTVPFIGQPLSVRFNFCTREQPFNLSVMAFGGGGFFGVTIDPHGVQILEASFEFGASLSVNFGVASGGVHIMAGIYFRMENNIASLTGYFRLGGQVSVLGLISASIELYLELLYVPDTGKCKGSATLTIEVSIFLYSASVKITCERTFAGSNGDPTFRQALGPQPQLALADELADINAGTAYAWRDYCEAFA